MVTTMRRGVGDEVMVEEVVAAVELVDGEEADDPALLSGGFTFTGVVFLALDVVVAAADPPFLFSISLKLVAKVVEPVVPAVDGVFAVVLLESGVFSLM